MEIWWVDEGNLCRTNLHTSSVNCTQQISSTVAHTSGKSFDKGPSKVESRPLSLTPSIPCRNGFVSQSSRVCWGLGPYHCGNHLPVQSNLAFRIPVHVHVEPDKPILIFPNFNIREADGHWPKVQFGEMKSLECLRKHGRKHGFDYLFDHLATGDIDIGPHQCKDIIEEACTGYTD